MSSQPTQPTDLILNHLIDCNRSSHNQQNGSRQEERIYDPPPGRASYVCCLGSQDDNDPSDNIHQDNGDITTIKHYLAPFIHQPIF